DSLLVATVLEKGASTRTVRFPAGEVFYDLTTRRRHEGGTTHVEPVGRESIPLYVRGGGLIPLAVAQPTRLDRDETEVLRLLCAPDRDGSFVLYEDDGRTRAHERGERRETRITMTAGSTVHLGLERHGSYRSAVRTLLLDVINPDRAPLRVLVDGVAIARLAAPAPLEDPAQLRPGRRVRPDRGAGHRRRSRSGDLVRPLRRDRNVRPCPVHPPPRASRAERCWPHRWHSRPVVRPAARASAATPPKPPSPSSSAWRTT